MKNHHFFSRFIFGTPQMFSPQLLENTHIFRKKRLHVSESPPFVEGGKRPRRGTPWLSTTLGTCLRVALQQGKGRGIIDGKNGDDGMMGRLCFVLFSPKKK